MTKEKLSYERNKSDAVGAVCYTASKFAGSIPLMGWLASETVDMACGDSARNKKYRKFIPVIRALIKTEGRDSENVNNMLEELGDLASFGARRQNFRTRYIDDKAGWKLLPDDPQKIPFGFW